MVDEDVLELLVPVEGLEKILVNHGEEEFEEGLKARKTVKAMKAEMKP